MSTLGNMLVEALRMEREVALHLQSEVLHPLALEEELREAEVYTDRLVRQLTSTLDVVGAVLVGGLTEMWPEDIDDE